MKKLLLIIGVLNFGSLLFAQPFTIYIENNCAEVNGSSISYSGGSYNQPANANANALNVVNFYFKNTSGSSKYVVVKRSRICVPAEWHDGLCWGNVCQVAPGFEGGCYTSVQMATNPWTSPGVTVESDSLAELKVDIATVDVGVGGHYRYYFMEGNTVLDSVDLTISGGCSLNVSNQEAEAFLSVYPNPADDHVVVSTFGLSSSAVIRFTDLSGKIMREEEISSTKTLRTDDLKNGVYWITLIDNGMIVQIRRLVIKH